MLHEAPGKDSATRRFRGEAVLRWTVKRLRGDPNPGPLSQQRPREEDFGSVVLCWEDQAAAVGEAIAGTGAVLSVRGVRQANQQILAIAAARRWADGWRGGLMGTCEFDRGFHGESAAAVCREHEADAVMLVDPSAGLVDRELIEGMIRHSQTRPD